MGHRGRGAVIGRRKLAARVAVLEQAVVDLADAVAAMAEAMADDAEDRTPRWKAGT